MTAELTELDKELNQQDFWNDHTQAQRVLQRRKHIDRMLETGKALEGQVGDLEALQELAGEGEPVTEEFASELARLRGTGDGLDRKSDV